MIRTQIQLTEEQARKLKHLAAERHISMAELIRQGVDAIVQKERLFDHEEQRQRAIKATGRFRSGCRDLAAEHDRYLEEAYGK